ncbi:MAG TPA: hypothetical protein DCL44_10200 [Elusimicrobia bacterium]|nr:hypothetical protein [Elusimicrobiota bacterium]
MKILFLTIGTEIVASSRTRVYQFLPHLKKAGVEAVVMPYDYTETFANIIIPIFAKSRPPLKLLRKAVSFCSNLLNIVIRLLQTIRFLSSLRRFDVIYIQKLALPVFLQNLIKRANPNIAFDFDDAVFIKDESGYKARFDHMITSAGLVTVENDYTTDYARRLNAPVLRMTGPIDCSRYTPRPGPKTPGEDIVIGWIGSDSTAEYLLPVAGALKILCEEHPNLHLEFIGARKLDALGGRSIYKKWAFGSEAADLKNFDIGIMPLPDNEWTRGKGGYKILQYMAAGIPSVASPVGINSLLIRDGETGFLATTPGEWRDRLKKLITDAGLRRFMGKSARKEAEEKYSFEFYTPQLISRLEGLKRTSRSV